MTNAAVLGEVLTDTPTGELVAAVSAALDEPGWLLTHRLAALSAYHSLQWPSGQEEEWRRTPMTDVPLERYRLPLNGQSGAAEGASPVSLDAFRVDERGGLVEHLDDSVTRAEIAAELNARGVLLLPLSTAAREHEELVRQHLNSVVPFADDRFAALSGALWSQGLFCYVPRNVVVEPTLVHRLGKSTGGRGLFGHTLVVAEDGASVTLLEVAASDDAESPSFCQRTVEVIAKDNAQVRLVGLQRWGNDVYSFVTERARLGRDANVLVASVAFGGALSKERIEVVLAGDGSNADLIALFVGGGQQHIEYNTRQDHLGVGSSSDLLIKGVLTDQANAVQYGVIKIAPGAQKTHGYQTMRNLLLSDGARADPIPVLEIEADDVKCSHAAAVGPVDREHVFYLQSRGIPEDAAERMVVQGFLDVAAQRLPDEQIRAGVEKLVEQKLNAGTQP